jgi:ABC-type dipeptide/oligopeptide/nickel transport system ATPase subunit
MADIAQAAVPGVNAELYSGELLVLPVASGSGKSTLRSVKQVGFTIGVRVQAY